MALSLKCSGCNRTTSCIVAAQYTNINQQHLIICGPCYFDGYRCWVLSDETLYVSIDQPENSRPAVLYWDEGGLVTGGNEPILYPNTCQPKE